jgi:putative intracellular protease/amidase
VVCAVTGLPGVGKTQVAAAYARAAGRLGVLRRQGPCGAGRPIAGGLRQCVDPAHLTPWLPSAGRAQVVITSTQHAFENVGTPVEVDLFSPDETVDYLQERTGLGDPAGAAAVGDELGRLPVALAQAAAVIRRERLSYPTYLHRLRTLSVGDYLPPVPGDPYPKAAAEAILLALQDAESVGGPTRRLLDLLAVLSSDGVPRDFLHEGANLLADRLTVADLDRLLGRLRDASFVVVSVDGGTVALHRLIQRVLRDRATRDGTLAAIVDRAARLLETAQLDDVRTIATRDRCEQIVEHSTALWNAANRLEDDQARSVLSTVLNCRVRTLESSSISAIRPGVSSWAKRYAPTASESSAPIT